MKQELTRTMTKN